MKYRIKIKRINSMGGVTARTWHADDETALLTVVGNIVAKPKLIEFCVYPELDNHQSN